MNLRSYLTEKTLSKEEWEKKIKKLDSSIQRQYKSTIQKIIKGNNDYKDWDDISVDAYYNADKTLKGVKFQEITQEEMFTDKWLKAYKSSLDAFLESHTEKL